MTILRRAARLSPASANTPNLGRSPTRAAGRSIRLALGPAEPVASPESVGAGPGPFGDALGSVPGRLGQVQRSLAPACRPTSIDVSRLERTLEPFEDAKTEIPEDQIPAGSAWASRQLRARPRSDYAPEQLLGSRWDEGDAGSPETRSSRVPSLAAILRSTLTGATGGRGPDPPPNLTSPRQCSKS